MATQNQLQKTSLEQLVLQAQAGDKEKHEYLLRSYQPFMVKVVSNVCKRYIDPVYDDEFSVGLSAFNEAIILYSPEKGSSFLSFAKLVMTRKVIDYIRYNARRRNVLSFDYYYNPGSMENTAEVSAVLEQFQDELDAYNRRAETHEFGKKLAEYNISLLELSKIAPKHEDSRKTAMETALILLEREELKQFVIRKKKLPIKKLLPFVKVSRKTLERNRKYILAMFIVLYEDYVYLKEYMK